MNENKTLRVARTEYMNQVRTKAFIIAVVLMPILMGGGLVVQAFMHDRKDLTDRTVAVVDETGVLYDAIASAAEARNTQAIWSDEDGERVQKDARWIVEASSSDPVKLSDRVRSDELFAYVVIPADAITAPGVATIAYHTNTPTYDALPRWLRVVINGEVHGRRFEAAQLDKGVVKRLITPVPLRQFGLVKVTDSGEIKEAEEVNKVATLGVPFGSMMLLFMLVMMACPALMNNVLEEKMQRISEVLVSSVSAFQLFLGKLIGTVLVSWTISVMYLGGVAFLAHRFGFLDMIPPAMFGWFLFFQLIALFIFGSIFSGLGAACSELRDAQTMMMPAMILVMIPMFTWFAVVEAPSGTFAIALSLFPPSAPFIMLIRLAVPPGPAMWEIVTSVVLTVAFTVFCVWAASRIFRVGILSQGQAPSFRKMIRWVFAD